MYVVPPAGLVERDIEEAMRPEVPCLPVNKRINNFNEVNLNITEEAAIIEARRCLRCDLETEDGEKVILEK
jgi:NADH-quinone oxidoreductase subunit F